jgi:hypothetical protein
VLISAWTGVNGVLAQALGNHRAAFGAGSTTTVADPGPIGVNAGALVYAVSMINAVYGSDVSAGFANLAVQSQSNQQLVAVDRADTAVQASAGTVDPRWTWYFQSATSWLGSVLALNP